MANLALQKFRPGSSILPSSSFRPEPGKQAAELHIDTQKRLPTLALFPNGPPSGYLDPAGNLALNRFPENQLNQKPFTVKSASANKSKKAKILNLQMSYRLFGFITIWSNIVFFCLGDFIRSKNCKFLNQGGEYTL